MDAEKRLEELEKRVAKLEMLLFDQQITGSYQCQKRLAALENRVKGQSEKLRQLCFILNATN